MSEERKRNIFDIEPVWGDFVVGFFFDIHPTATYKLGNRDLLNNSGHIPVLSNSSINNGIGGFSYLEATEQGKIITFSDTTTGPNTMFYQQNPFIGYPHVQGMYPNDKHHWSDKECLYLISAINQAAGTKWSYSIKFTRKFVSTLKISLPILTDSNKDPIIDPTHEHSKEGYIPDWDYMDSYIRQIEGEYVRQIEGYLMATGLEDYILTEEEMAALEKEPVWGEFSLYGIFGNPTRGTRLTRLKRKPGSIPLATAGFANNGIAEYISNKEQQTFSSGITIDMFGNCFYRNYPYKADDNILSFDNKALSEESKLYITSAINMALENRYTYSNQYRLNTYNNTTISLPVTPSGSPDFAFMETYIRAIEKLVIADVVEFKNKRLELTKTII